MDDKEIEYLVLIERVRKLDTDAATYLEVEAREMSSFTPSGKLLSIFYWSESPQGVRYWSRLDDLI